MAAHAAIFTRPRSAPGSPHKHSTYDPYKVDLSKCVNPGAMQAFFSASDPRAEQAERQADRAAGRAAAPQASPQASPQVAPAPRPRSASSDSTASSVRSELVASLSSMWGGGRPHASPFTPGSRALRHSYPGPTTPASASPSRHASPWRAPAPHPSGFSPPYRLGGVRLTPPLPHAPQEEREEEEEKEEKGPPAKQTHPSPTRASLLREQEQRLRQQQHQQQQQPAAHETFGPSRGRRPAHERLERVVYGPSGALGSSMSSCALGSPLSGLATAGLAVSGGSPPRWRHSDQHLAVRAQSPPSQATEHRRPPPPPSRGGPPDVFLEMLEQIERRLGDLPRAVRIRVERWVAKLAYQVDHATWVKERNLYCAALLHAVTTNRYPDPFHAGPPEGNLPALPAWVRRAYSRKGVGAGGAPMGPAAPKSAVAVPPFWQPAASGGVGTSLNAPAATHDPRREWHGDEAVRVARRIAAGQHLAGQQPAGPPPTASHSALQGQPASPDNGAARSGAPSRGRGESTLTLTLRHSGGRSQAATAPRLPPKQPTARPAAFARSGGFLEGGGAAAEVVALRRKVAEADARADGLAAAAGAAASRHQEALHNMADAHQAEVRQLQRAHGDELAALQTRHANQAARRVDATATIRDPALKPQPPPPPTEQAPPRPPAAAAAAAAAAALAATTAEGTFRFGGGAPLLRPIAAAPPSAYAAVAPTLAPPRTAAAVAAAPAAAAPRTGASSPGDFAAVAAAGAAHASAALCHDDDAFLDFLDTFEATAAAALAHAALAATNLTATSRPTAAAAAAAGGPAHFRR